VTYHPADHGWTGEQATVLLAAIVRCHCGRNPQQCYSAYTWCPPWRNGEFRLGLSEAEAADMEALSKGRAVPHHMGACASSGCWHGNLWHERHGKRPCTRPGCPCAGYSKPERAAS
jgi:hypothetical protein